MTTTTLAAGIFLVRFKSQHELAATFLRFQEHYESSRFRGRVFTLEAYMDWYASRFGAFTYFQDWSGFNVPSAAFEPFFAGRFDPLSRKERRLLRRFRRERRPYYVIGISSDADLRHELAHALFFTSADYRAAVLAAMRGHDFTALRRQLTAMGYHRRVLTDETHAYLVAPGGRVNGGRRLAPLARALRAIFDRHVKSLRLPRRASPAAARARPTPRAPRPGRR